MADNSDIDKILDELEVKIAEFSRSRYDKEIEKQMHEYVKDGMAKKNEKGEYYPTTY